MNVKAFFQDNTALFISHKIIEPDFFDMIYVVEDQTITRYDSVQAMLAAEQELSICLQDGQSLGEAG